MIDRLIAASLKLGRGAAGDSILAWRGEDAYVLSYDRTICIHCWKMEEQTGEVSFRVCDYECPKISTDGEWVTFHLADSKITVPAPVETFKGIAALFSRLKPAKDNEHPKLILDRKILRNLSDDLPHVEFVWDGSDSKIIQRDIYTGKIVEIAVVPHPHKIEQKPLAIRSADIFTMFSLGNSFMVTACEDYFHLTDLNKIEAIIGGCLYDDIGKLNVKEE